MMRNNALHIGAVRPSAFILIISVLSAVGGTGPARAVAPDDYLAMTFTDSVGFTVPFRLFVPPSYDSGGSYPIVMFLHGSGGRGNDNLKQISGGNTRGATVWAEPINQASNAAFVLAPQAPSGSGWGRIGQALSSPMRASLELLDHLETEYSIDVQREYVTGQSLGGFGTWAALGAQPDRFAAGVPLAGGGNPSFAGEIATVPQWIFHDAQDPTVPVENSRLKGGGAARSWRHSHLHGV